MNTPSGYGSFGIGAPDLFRLEYAGESHPLKAPRQDRSKIFLLEMKWQPSAGIKFPENRLLRLPVPWKRFPAAGSFQNVLALLLPEPFDPVVKSTRVDVMLQTPLVIRKTTLAAFHNQAVLFLG